MISYCGIVDENVRAKDLKFLSRKALTLTQVEKTGPKPKQVKDTH